MNDQKNENKEQKKQSNKKDKSVPQVAEPEYIKHRIELWEALKKKQEEAKKCTVPNPPVPED